MQNKGGNISLASYDDIFSTDRVKEDAGEKVQEVALTELHPFRDHPFKVLDDESMQKTVESIEQYGVLTPAIVRPRAEGGYELISGHRRAHASELAGKKTMPVIVRQMDDDAAVILMVDSNLQREHILPSERAKAYKMKMDALKHQGKRSDMTSCQIGTKLRADEQLAQEIGESARTVQRFVRLNNLIPELLDLVDEKKIAFNPAVELSYMKEDEQKEFFDTMNLAQTTPSLSQAQRLKKSSQEGKCTTELMERILDEEKKNPMDRVVFESKVLYKYFPVTYTTRQIQEQIIAILEQWNKSSK